MHTAMSESDALDVAIIGAGIAGLAAAIALKPHPRINVQLYERASELKEIGASIALGPNGMRTLERLGVNNALLDDIAFRNHSGCPMIYRYITSCLEILYEILTDEIGVNQPLQNQRDRLS